MEAMRCGCPVIAINNSSIPEVTGRAAFLIEGPNVDSLVDGINKVLDVDVAERMRSAGYEQSIIFSWDRCFKETQDIYNLLM